MSRRSPPDSLAASLQVAAADRRAEAVAAFELSSVEVALDGAHASSR